MYFLLDIYLCRGDVSAFWLALASVAALTDKLDGFLAKRYGWTSRLGAYLDHMSDKMVTFVVYAALTMITEVGSYVLAGIVFRELWVTGLRTVGNRLRVKVVTSQAGRLKTFFQQVAALVLVVNWALPKNVAGFTYAQYVVWGGFGIFWLCLLGKGKKGFRWFRSVYTVKLKRADGETFESRLDYYLVFSCFLLVLVPFDWIGATTVLYITLGTGVTYAINFFYAVRRRSRRQDRRFLGWPFWGGGAVDLVVSLGLAALLWQWVERYRDSTTVMAALVCGYSLLFAVFLVINYRTSGGASDGRAR